MILDEAIKHAEEKAEELRERSDVLSETSTTSKGKEISDCLECAEEHEQLAEWLEELKAYREKERRDCSTCARYSEFQTEIPEECMGCTHNYFSNYKEKANG